MLLLLQMEIIHDRMVFTNDYIIHVFLFLHFPHMYVLSSIMCINIFLMNNINIVYYILYILLLLLL